jgi:hypothetical protein
MNEDQLLGLGEVQAIAGPNPGAATVSMLQQAAKKGAQKSRVDQVLTRPQKMLLLKIGQANADTLKRYNAGGLKLTDENYYVRQKLTAAAGSIPFWDETIIKKPGTTNLHNGKLPAGVTFLLAAISVGFVTDATVTDPGLVIYNSYETTLPPALANAELELSIDGKALPAIPFSQLIVYGDSASANALNREKHVLGAPELITEKTVITAQIIFPAGGALIASTNNFLAVNLHGPGLRPKA